MPKHAKNVEAQEANENANASAQQAILAAISKLREEVMGKISSTASAHSDQLRGLQDTVEKMRTTVEATTNRVTELESAVSGHSDAISTLEAEMLAVKGEMSTLKERCEDLEARSRRCNVRIMGVKEGREVGERMSNFVARLLKEALALDKPPLLDRAHRSLRSKPTAENAPPRAIIVRCHYFEEKEAILRKATERRPITTAAGDKISVLPDYTQAVSKQRAAFTEIRALLRNYEQVRYGLLFPATLRVTTPNGKEVRFKDPGQAKDFIVKNLTPKVD